jgi:error-prone DNA polymerase
MRGIVSNHEAMQKRAGARVTVAGLNIRPHRPPSKSGGRHLFTTLEDESAYFQASFYGDAVDHCVATVVLSPVVIARGIVKRQGLGVSLEVERIWPLRMRDWVHQEQGELQEEMSEYQSVRKTGINSAASVFRAAATGPACMMPTLRLIRFSPVVNK